MQPVWSKIKNAHLHRNYKHCGFYVMQNDNLMPSDIQRGPPDYYTAMIKFGETADFLKRQLDNTFTSCFLPNTWRIKLFIEVRDKKSAQRVESAFKNWLIKRSKVKNDVYLYVHRKDVILCKNWKNLRNDFLSNLHPNNILKNGENFISRFKVIYVGIDHHNDWLRQQ